MDNEPKIETNKMDELVEKMNNLFDKKIENFNRRMKEEITGSELDKLNNEIDKEIDLYHKSFLELIKNREESKDINVPQKGEFDGETKIKKSSLEEINKSKIDVAHDLRQLTRNLNEIGDITAPDGYVYKKDYLIDIIVNLKGSNDENINKITNIYGLRDTVKKLLLRKELSI